jgi:hypothetical protein
MRVLISLLFVFMTIGQVWAQDPVKTDSDKSNGTAGREQVFEKRFGMLREPHASAGSAERKIVNDVKTRPFVPSIYSGQALSPSKDSQRVFQQAVKICPEPDPAAAV